MKVLLDDPIQTPDEDDLGRLSFATALAALIAAMPQDTSARFAVYGEWGEGKTSVMRLIARQLQGSNHLVAWYSPWAFESVEDAWHALIGAMAAASGADKKWYARVKYQATRGLAALGRSTDAIAEISDYSKPLKILSAPFEKGAMGLIKKGRNIALSSIRNALDGRRLTIFVDDLDRVDARLVPRLLMSFRETFDLPGCTFVLGLSPSLIEEGLRHAGYTEGDSSRRFLEKIVEYPHYLPPMTRDGRARLVRRAARESPLAVRAEAIEAISDVLPTNPRRLKVFLRHVLSLGPLLSRLTDEEISWTEIYTALLLRLEFPAETHRLMVDDTVLKDLTSRAFMRIAMEGEKNKELSRPEETYAPAGTGRDRFLALCDGLVGGDSWRPHRYSLRQVLSLPDDPPATTWLEINVFFEKAAHLDRNAVAALAHGTIGATTLPQTEANARAQVLFDGMVELREALLDAAMDTNDPAAAQERLDRADAATVTIYVLAIDLGWFASGVLTALNWRRLYTHCQKWARYTADSSYASARARELELLRAVTSVLPKDVQLDINASLNASLPREDETSGDFIKLRDDLGTRVGATVVEHLVRAFETPDGIESYLHQEWNWKGRNFLFDPESPFHDAAVRQQLSHVVANAAEFPSIVSNFYVYFQMLVGGALEGGVNLSSGDCQRLLKDDAFLLIVWRGMTVRTLPLRTMGSMLDARRKLAMKIGVSRSSMPIPASWATYAAAFPEGNELVQELSAR